MRQATQAEWSKIVEQVRAGGGEHMAGMLMSGHLNWTTASGETVSPPSEVLAAAMSPAPVLTTTPVAMRSLATARANGEPMWNGRTWEQLSFPEKHALSDENPDLYLAMRNFVPKWNGKTLTEMSDEECAELFRTDRALYTRMEKGL